MVTKNSASSSIESRVKNLPSSLTRWWKLAISCFLRSLKPNDNTGISKSFNFTKIKTEVSYCFAHFCFKFSANVQKRKEKNCIDFHPNSTYLLLVELSSKSLQFSSPRTLPTVSRKRLTVIHTEQGRTLVPSEQKQKKKRRKKKKRKIKKTLTSLGFGRSRSRSVKESRRGALGSHRRATPRLKEPAPIIGHWKCIFRLSGFCARRRGGGFRA